MSAETNTSPDARSLPQGPIYSRAYKSLLLAYALLLIAFGLGFHRFYLGYRRTAVAQVALFVAMMVLVFAGVGPLNIAFVTLFGWCLVDLVMLPWLTRWRNEAIAGQITRSLSRT